jgi:hypothetical protein
VPVAAARGRVVRRADGAAGGGVGATLAGRSRPLDRLEAWRAYALGLWEYRRGRAEEAARDLGEAKSLVDEAFAPRLAFDRQGVWFDWLYMRILLREAADRSEGIEEN